MHQHLKHNAMANYIIVSEGNKWLDTLRNATPNDVEASFKEIVEDGRNDGERMFAYETVGEAIESKINAITDVGPDRLRSRTLRPPPPSDNPRAAEEHSAIRPPVVGEPSPLHE